MGTVNLTRRLTLVLPVFLLFPLSACSPNTSGPDKLAEDVLKLKFMSRFAAHLFPIEGVEPDSFDSVGLALLDNPDLSAPIDSAIEALNAAAGSDWFSQDKSAQIEAMASVETQPWFTTLFVMSRAAFFDLPQVWTVLDFEGPSIEFGGYIDKGFDDIDWLPEVGQ